MPKDASAPGSLELVRSFVNSVDLDRPGELDALASIAAARVWLTDNGLCAELQEAQLPGLRALREALRAELLAHNGEGAAKSAWEALARSFEGASARIVLGADGAVRLEVCPGDETHELRDSLAAALYDAVRGGSWPRLKACRKPDCRYAFYDRSKNGSGAWCDMGTCGNRAKAERRRARERKSASD